MTVRSVTSTARPATWSRGGGELPSRPRRRPADGRDVHRRRALRRRPAHHRRPVSAASGFVHTDDGAIVIGQPHVAATWFPVNDHPQRQGVVHVRGHRARGLEAVANGVLAASDTTATGRPGRGRPASRWRRTWRPRRSASSTSAAYRGDGHQATGTRSTRTCSTPAAAPRTGAQFAISPGGRLVVQAADPHDPRARGRRRRCRSGSNRDTEPAWDFVFVEARTVGGERLDDAAGRERPHQPQHRRPCPYWLDLHPFLRHYQTADATTAARRGHHGAVVGGQRARRRLGALVASTCRRYAGSQVEVSITYASDDVVPVRRRRTSTTSSSSTGGGTTSFEADGDTLDGWTVAGPPPGSPGNPNDWVAGTAGRRAAAARRGRRAVARPPAGDPRRSWPAGSARTRSAPPAASSTTRRRSASRWRTRPGRSTPTWFFTTRSTATAWSCTSWPTSGTATAWPWTRWRHIWLNEGFATYAEWLWSEREGLGHARRSCSTSTTR